MNFLSLLFMGRINRVPPPTGPVSTLLKRWQQSDTKDRRRQMIKANFLRNKGLANVAADRVGGGRVVSLVDKA